MKINHHVINSIGMYEKKLNAYLERKADLAPKVAEGDEPNK